MKLFENVKKAFETSQLNVEIGSDFRTPIVVSEQDLLTAARVLAHAGGFKLRIGSFQCEDEWSYFLLFSSLWNVEVILQTRLRAHEEYVKASSVLDEVLSHV